MICKHNNKGISYIEFILVLAIMVLLTGLATVSMSIVNRNNVTKGADRVTTGINHAKTLSLSKGSNKGCITFASNGNYYYYYYGENENDKYKICSAPCSLTVTIKGTPYTISNTQKIRLKISQSTGAFTDAERKIGNGAFTSLLGSNGFSGVNRIVINNNHGKTANIDLNIHVGTVKVSY